jgi:hypothetical protein
MPPDVEAGGIWLVRSVADGALADGGDVAERLALDQDWRFVVALVHSYPLSIEGHLDTSDVVAGAWSRPSCRIGGALWLIAPSKQSLPGNYFSIRNIIQSRIV